MPRCKFYINDNEIPGDFGFVLTVRNGGDAHDDRPTRLRLIEPVRITRRLDGEKTFAEWARHNSPADRRDCRIDLYDRNQILIKSIVLKDAFISEYEISDSVAHSHALEIFSINPGTITIHDKEFKKQLQAA